MRSILEIKPLVFEAINDDEGGTFYAANNAFGRYSYHRGDDGFEVFSHFGDEDCEHFVTTGDAMTAQRACHSDFRARIMESLGLNNQDDDA